MEEISNITSHDDPVVVVLCIETLLTAQTIVELLTATMVEEIRFQTSEARGKSPKEEINEMKYVVDETEADTVTEVDERTEA